LPLDGDDVEDEGAGEPGDLDEYQSPSG